MFFPSPIIASIYPGERYLIPPALHFLIVTKQLFVNLRNAAASFGTESIQYQRIHKTVYDHLRQMQSSGLKTDLTGAKEAQKDPTGLAAAFEKLDIQLKTHETRLQSGDKMEE